MNLAGIVFDPTVPLWLLIALGALSLVVLGISLIKRARGTWWRALTMALVLGTLAGPVLVREERRPLEDTALIVVDRSASQRITGHLADTETALEGVQRRLDNAEDLTTRVVNVESNGADGTRLIEAIQRGLSEIETRRLAGVVVLSDGQAHDMADAERLDIAAPVHLLLSGRPGERDRRLVIEEAPSYALVGEPQRLRIRVDDLGVDQGSGPIPVVVRQDGDIINRLMVASGTVTEVVFELQRAGDTVIEVEAEPLRGELSQRNNRSVAFVNGVRDRLRVLLVSGQPYPGLRVWRNLLKADPAVDLVHFTILRPPEKQDGTPINELALIAFPTRELFEVKLGEFDLVIFDRYARRGLLPMAYLDNVARYVERGGALLEAAGPEFAYPLSLYRTPLSRVLPGAPSGRVFEQEYRPGLTELGGRHPVTAGLTLNPTEPSWGPWYRQVDVDARSGQVLMSGVSDRPLLVLDRVGEGRVAQLLSDHHWLWARGHEGGGPQGQLLRRLVHWLMQEPELEENDLIAEAQDGRLRVTKRQLEPRPVEVRVTSPSGVESTARLDLDEGGVARTTFNADEPGLYRITDGDLTRYVAVRPIAERELADLRATQARMAPLLDRTGGGAFWAQDGLPNIRRTAGDGPHIGGNWLGLKRNGDYQVTGANLTPLLPAWLALALILGALGATWYREGR